MQFIQRAIEQGTEQEKQTLTFWPTLSDEEKAFVAAYVENSYNITAASKEIGKTTDFCRRLLMVPSVKKAVTEVQNAVGDIDHMNERWVKAHLMRMMPMVMGDEAVPFVDNTGAQVEARKFNPEVAMKIVEYVAPKSQRVEHVGQVTMVTRRVVKASDTPND